MKAIGHSMLWSFIAALFYFSCQVSGLKVAFVSWSISAGIVAYIAVAFWFILSGGNFKPKDRP
jgi:hypothetical protein